MPHCRCKLVRLPVQPASRSIVGMSQLSQFALFVSCVEGSLVTRYGTRTFIGAERRTDDPRQIDYHPEQVVAIPHDEHRRYRREYLRALREGSLVERTEDEWQQQNRQDEPSAAGEAHPARHRKRSELTPHDDPARRRTGD
jgi:hypothetical protein